MFKFETVLENPLKGFSQVKDVYYNETYAPVVRLATVRYFMSLTVKMGLKILQIDAVTVFFLGDREEEEIYMEQPKGFVSKAPHKVCKLNKSLYGSEAS